MTVTMMTVTMMTMMPHTINSRGIASLSTLTNPRGQASISRLWANWIVKPLDPFFGRHTWAVLMFPNRCNFRNWNFVDTKSFFLMKQMLFLMRRFLKNRVRCNASILIDSHDSQFKKVGFWAGELQLSNFPHDSSSMVRILRNCRPAAMVLLAMSWLSDSIVASQLFSTVVWQGGTQRNCQFFGWMIHDLASSLQHRKEQPLMVGYGYFLNFISDGLDFSILI